MAKEEYVFRLVRRDADHPLLEKTILEHGVPVSDAEAFGKTLHALSNLIRIYGTPEAAVEAMQRHKKLQALKLIT